MVRRLLHFVSNRERMKKLMDWLAYGSLGLDICITIITLSSLFFPNNLGQYLGSVNIILSLVVVLSIVSALLMVGSRIYEALLFRTFHLRLRVKNHISTFRNRLQGRQY